jgi:hypothetical protein
MKPSRKKMVLAVFQNRDDAERAFDLLYARGYRDSEINVLMTDQTRSNFYPDAMRDEHRHDTGTRATEGMGVGGAVGGAVGATLAAVAAIGTSIAIPGLGIFVAGPIAAALAGGGAGALTGGLIGLLAGAGIPAQNVEAYQAALRDGGVVFGVVPRNREDATELQERFREFNAENVCYA